MSYGSSVGRVCNDVHGVLPFHCMYPQRIRFLFGTLDVHDDAELANKKYKSCRTKGGESIFAERQEHTRDQWTSMNVKTLGENQTSNDVDGNGDG